MNKPESVVPAQTHSRVIRIGWLFAAVVLIQFAGLLIPPPLGWGFNFWRLFPFEAAASVLGFSFFVMTPVVHTGRVLEAGQAPSAAMGKFEHLNGFLLASAFSLLMIAAFYILRSRAHVYGDGFLAIEVASTPMEYWPFGGYFMKPLSMLLYRLSALALSPGLGISLVHMLSLLSAIAGVIAFWALYKLSRLMVTGTGRQWFLVLGSLIGGGTVLFFGYIEYYPPAVSLALLSLAFTIGYLRHKNRLWPALLTGIIATGLHLFALPALAISIVAWWVSPNRHGEFRRRFSFKRANLTLIVLSVVGAIMFQISGLEGPILAVWPNASHGYWAFGLSHLLDIANEIVLVAPMGLIGLVMAGLGREKPNNIGLQENMLISVSLFFFLLAFWINPELGAARDWDLLSFFGIPFSMWGAYSLIKNLPEYARIQGLLIQASVLCLVVLAPNIYEKNDLAIAAERLDNILWEDPHYQSDYRDAYNSYQWSGTLIRHVGEPERAIRHLMRSAQSGRPSSARYAALATAYNRAGVSDSAYLYYREALDLDPGNERILKVLADFELRAKRFDRLQMLAGRAVKANPGSGENHYLLSFAYSRRGKLDSALAQARVANTLRPNSKPILVQLGTAHGMMNQHDSAYYYISRAFEIAGPQNFRKSDYYALFSGALNTGRLQQARLALTAIERLQPKEVNENNYLHKLLREAIERTGHGK